MAEDIFAPPKTATAPVAEVDPFAPPVPPWYMDIAKTAVPSTVRGVTGLATGVPSITDLAAKGVAYGAEKLQPDIISPETAEKIKSGSKAVQDFVEPATYGSVMGRIENKGIPSLGVPGTGKLYEPQTPAGKVVGTTLEIAPSMFGGATGVIPKLEKPAEKMVRALAGGAGATGLESFAENYLPEWTKPYAKAVGGITGTMFGPKGVTPLPAVPEHLADVKTLKDAGMKGLSAGQVTGSPVLKQLESNIRGPSQTARNTEGFTTAVAEKSGMPEGTKALKPEAFAAADKNFETNLKNAVQAAEIKGTNFTDLQKDLAKIRKNAYKDLRDSGIGKIDDVLGRMAGSPGALSMPGGRYNQLRQEIQQSMNDKSLTGRQKEVLGEIKTRLDAAMGKEIPDLNEMHKGVANLGVLKGSAKQLDEKMQITPEGLKDAIVNKWGPEAYTGGRGMAPLAQAGERVLPLPKRQESGKLTEMAATGLGAALERMFSNKPTGGGGDSGFTGGILGHMLSNAMASGLRLPGRPLYATVEPYLRNQIFKHGETNADLANMLKALRAPPGAPLLAKPSE